MTFIMFRSVTKFASVRCQAIANIIMGISSAEKGELEAKLQTKHKCVPQQNILVGILPSTKTLIIQAANSGQYFSNRNSIRTRSTPTRETESLPCLVPWMCYGPARIKKNQINGVSLILLKNNQAKLQTNQQRWKPSFRCSAEVKMLYRSSVLYVFLTYILIVGH